MSAATSEPPRLPALADDYHPAPGAYDEMLAAAAPIGSRSSLR
jgi:hypothetical protein